MSCHPLIRSQASHQLGDHVADQPMVATLMPNRDPKFVALCFERDIIIIILDCANKLAIINIYASPTEDLEPKLQNIQPHLENRKEDDVIIIGDFNARSSVWGDILHND